MFTESDRTLLTRPLQAHITVAPKGERWPAPRPVWFELTADEELQIFSFAGTPRVSRLRENPRASIVVVAPVGEDEHWVSVEGEASIHTDGAHELAQRLADRYYGENDEAHRELVDSWMTEDLVRIVLHPEKVQRYRI
ncbi:pyridoxamine 5'-phosphate oxidase family protein [Herbiconiux sp. L3-i23]|uniref:pyridoxamine 5'-phosphate oxidase family protein n=1 Tax=Herbiconiux sp. L3-i23 TaxID=2905871 RepID=UPI00204DF16C|nr:pyridoxamine 5'-phosphate oxidase family protein [Herbiconiux sp. L3-i23]BDI23531.1 pyridoxamine 5'-phosphate oxidase [Herbiconiux sp. L3-i23]